MAQAGAGYRALYGLCVGLSAWGFGAACVPARNLALVCGEGRGHAHPPHSAATLALTHFLLRQVGAGLCVCVCLLLSCDQQ